MLSRLEWLFILIYEYLLTNMFFYFTTNFHLINNFLHEKDKKQNLCKCRFNLNNTF